MRATLDMLDRGLLRNASVNIQPNGRIVVSPLVALPEPVHLVGLKGELVQRWPMTSDILKETDLRVGITPQFASVASHEALDPETLQRRLLLCLYGLCFRLSCGAGVAVPQTIRPRWSEPTR